MTRDGLTLENQATGEQLTQTVEEAIARIQAGLAGRNAGTPIKDRG